MNPTQTGRLVSHYPIVSSSGERLRPETPQVRTSAHPSIAALPASVKIDNLTFHVGRVMTALSDSEAELLDSALSSETPKESLAHSPDKDGVYSYVIGAKDYFASHLPRQYPERMMLSCELDPSLGLKSVVISELKRDLKMGQIYCQAHFEPPHMATQAPASEQAASSMAALPPSRTNLSVFSNSDLMKELIQRHNPQDEGLRQGSGASVTTQSMAFSHNGSAGPSAGVPEPSRSRPAQAAPSEPYPSSQSGASSSRGKNVRVPDPEHPGQTISRAALASRKHDRQQVPDPEHPGQTLSRNALSKRQQVPDPEHPGQTISRGVLSQRQQVPDPEHPGQTISRAALASRKYDRQQVPDPQHLGQTISRAALRQRKQERQQVPDPEHPG